MFKGLISKENLCSLDFQDLEPWDTEKSEVTQQLV